MATAGWDVSALKNPCGPMETAARINDPAQSGEYVLGTHDYIWQVVPGLGAALVAEARCVHHGGGVAELNIFGGESESGPWTLVWTPFTTAHCMLHEWGDPLHAETRLDHGWAYYKVEFHGMYEEERGGVKFTSAYFASGK
jgi:hypothetical protein